MSDAYLDIATTDLSWLDAEITVIGICRANGKEDRTVQLVVKDITVDNLLEVVSGVNTLYTYNGSRFDLPFINGSLRVDLETIAEHHNLIYDCWQCNLFGGFKAVEQQLGIPRQLKGITGLDAVLLRQRYQSYGDLKALATLREYNEEDVMNLKVLKERLLAPYRVKGNSERISN